MNLRIALLGGVQLRQRGSHRLYQATSADGATNVTVVPQHGGDIPRGTLHQIEQDLEPVFGKGWLTDGQHR